MRYKLLGLTGLRVFELCLGTMTFGEDWGWGADKDEARRIFDGGKTRLLLPNQRANPAFASADKQE